MLTATQVLEKIAHWENQSTEFKREFSTDTVRKALVAFSNDYHEQGGGIIIVGVDEKNREIIGINEDTDALMQRIAGLCRDGNIVPSIAPKMYPLEVQGTILMVVEVAKSNRRPHRAQNICYIRFGTTNQRATPDEEFELTRRSGQIPFDLSPVRGASIANLDMDKFITNFLPFRISAEQLAINGRTPAQWLEHLKLAYNEGNVTIPTATALLLFGKRPQDFFPDSSIDFIRFEGNDKSYPIIDRKEIVGTLDNLVKLGVELVVQHSVQGYFFSDQSPVRRNTFEYPLRAIREAIANAVVHRDYEFSRSKVAINMFDDHIEIFSPGGLFGIMTRDNFGLGINDYRNPNIALGLNIMGLVEKAGTGILNIKRQMQENGSDAPIFDIGDKYLIAKLPAHHYYQAMRLYQKSLQTIEIGEHETAIDYLKKATQLSPNFTEAWTVLGRLLYSFHNNTDEARKSFLKSIECNPHFEKAYIEWAKMEEINGSIDQSMRVYNQGIIAIPDSYALHYALGMVYKQKRFWREATSMLRKANMLSPNTPNILLALGECFLQQRYWNDATEILKKLVELPNTNNQGYVYLLKALIGNKTSLDTVKYYFETAIQKNFKAQELFSIYYRYLTQTNQHAEALRIQDLAHQEGIPPLTPYFAEINVSGLPNLPNHVLEQKLSQTLDPQQCSYKQIKIWTNQKTKAKFAIISTDTDETAQKIITVLQNNPMDGRYPLRAHFHIRN